MRRKREQKKLLRIMDSAVDEVRRLENLEAREDAYAEEAHELLERLTADIQASRSKKTEKP